LAPPQENPRPSARGSHATGRSCGYWFSASAFVILVVLPAPTPTQVIVIAVLTPLGILLIAFLSRRGTTSPSAT
jgi:hypothetical protein